VVFYHSNATPPGAAGLARVAGPALPDQSQFDKKSGYFEPRAKKDKPVWYCVSVAFERQFREVIPLAAIRDNPRLSELPLLRPGQRLSIQPLTAEQFDLLVAMAEGGAGDTTAGGKR
jgi:predicted RNA-binding protein with PUA-like domain